MKKELKWKDGSTIEPKVGMKVKLGNAVRRIRALYSDTPGGERLCHEVEGFVSWNIDALVPVKKGGNYHENC